MKAAHVFIEPVLSTEFGKEDIVEVAIDWYDLFTKVQTVPRPTKTKDSREPTGEGSLMTEECTDCLVNAGDSASRTKERGELG